MTELEGIERTRMQAFALTGLGVGLAYLVATNRVLDAVLIGLCVGLLGSGLAVAKHLTSPYYWAAVEAEARLNGGSPRRWMVWVGNLLPFALATAATLGVLARLNA